MSQEENEITQPPVRGDRRKSSYWARKRRKNTKKVLKAKRLKELKESEEMFEAQTSYPHKKSKRSS